MRPHPWIFVFYLSVRAGFCLNAGCLFLRPTSFDGYSPLGNPVWEWTTPSQHSIACGVFCARDGNCLLFSFNELTNTCKGYSEDVNDISEMTQDTGSINYAKTCIIVETFKGLTLSPSFIATPGTTLPLNNEIALFGTADTVESGTFICPDSGIYKFLIHALPEDNTASVSVEVQIDGVAVVRIVGDDYNVVGNALVTHMVKGVEVRVLVRHGLTQGGVYGNNEKPVTTFTAVLIKKDNAGGTSEHFTVARSDAAIITPGSILIYDHVITDDEQLYNIGTGIATVKTSGLYIVHFFVATQMGIPAAFELYHNDNYVCSIGGEAAADKITSADNTVILYMLTGDQLTVRAISNIGSDLFVQGAFENSFITTLTASQIANDSDTLATSNSMNCWEGVYGSAYIGGESVTETGITCQEWAKQTPHSHGYTNDAKFSCDESMDVVSNYCRDADRSGYPWCFTTDPNVEKEICSVPVCPQIRRVTAFSVALSRNSEVRGGQRVKFDHYIYCVNCDYNIPNRKFTAVVAGLYEIHFSATGQLNQALNLELWVQPIQGSKRYIVSIIGERPGNQARGSNSALVYLNENDKVQVESAAGFTNSLHGFSYDLQCTFSGYLLK